MVLPPHLALTHIFCPSDAPSVPQTEAPKSLILNALCGKAGLIFKTLDTNIGTPSSSEEESKSIYQLLINNELIYHS